MRLYEEIWKHKYNINIQWVTTLCGHYRRVKFYSKKKALRERKLECKSPGVGPHASLYPVAPGTLFQETTAVLVLTADTFSVWTALLSTDKKRKIHS